MTSEIKVLAGDVEINGLLNVPKNSKTIILFAHGSGSGRLSSRNKFVAKFLNKLGFATLLMDLLTEKEEAIDMQTGELRFDIGFLANRLIKVADWVRNNSATKDLKIGYFGSSTGAAAALTATAKDSKNISSIVSRGGRPDLAMDDLSKVKVPTLLIVGGEDKEVITMNEQAFNELKIKEKQIQIIPGATHLFEEPGKLEIVARLAGEWFLKWQ